MPEPVTIPISFFEVVVEYEQPAIRLLADRATIVQGILDAWKPWTPNIDDVELRTVGKPSEQGVLLKLPLQRASFFIGAAFCRFSRDDSDWETADETIAIFDAAVLALMKFSGVVAGTRRTSIGLHLQPRTKHYMEILRPFMSSLLTALEKEPLRTMAVVAKWANRKVTIDGSGSLVNGLFLKFERDFAASSPYTEIASQLKSDEEQLFRLLGVEEARG
jgi:hypothetical protein